VPAQIIPTRHVDPLDVFPPEGEFDPLVRRVSKKLALKPKYAKSIREAEDLVRDSGITLDIERLRDRVERRFGGLDRLVLSEPGVLHQLLLGALEADDLKRDEIERDKEREARQRARKRERETERKLRQSELDKQHQVRAEEVKLAREVNKALLESLTQLMETNKEMLQLIRQRPERGDGKDSPAATHGNPGPNTTVGEHNQPEPN